MKKRNESRQDYETDKKTATSDKSTVFFSVDLQKVVLLPRLPGYKKCIFTSRLITFNMTFAPIGVQGKCNSSKAQGILWHEAICGRRDKDITSAYYKMFCSPLYRNYKNYVIWVDNCGGQNKCWTLYTMLVKLLNTYSHIDKITLKYFTVGHSFMSADNFHRSVEKEMKAMDKVFDFHDFTKCVANVCDAVVMTHKDFYDFVRGLSEGKASKLSRPYLSDVYIAEFRRGSMKMYYKLHNDDSFKDADFLKRNVKKSIKIMPPQQQQQEQGIKSKKKETILKNLSSLICR